MRQIYKTAILVLAFLQLLGILKTTDNLPTAQTFLDFMLSEEIQELDRKMIPQTRFPKDYRS